MYGAEMTSPPVLSSAPATPLCLAPSKNSKESIV